MALLAGLVFFKATLHDNFVLYFFTSSWKFDLLFCVASVFFHFRSKVISLFACRMGLDLFNISTLALAKKFFPDF